MTTFFSTLKRLWGIDTPAFGLIVTAVILYAAAWWMRETTSTFNSAVLFIGGGVVLINTGLTALYARREPFLGYVFGGASVMVQIFLLILLWMAARGLVL